MDILREQANLLKAQTRKIDAEASIKEAEATKMREEIEAQKSQPF
jgi:hypothetical protein